MRFITPDNSEPLAAARTRRWTGPAALLAGLAVLGLLALSVAFIFSPDPARVMLDPIDQAVAAADWPRVEALCRRHLREHASSQPGQNGSSWIRRVDPAAELALRLGISLSMQERYDEARTVLDGALERKPKDERLALNRALVDYRAGSLDEALVRLQQLAERADYAPHVHYHIGRIYETRGQYDRALQAYRDELNISSSAAAWQRYMVLKRMKGATTSRPSGDGPASTQEAQFKGG